MAARCRARLGPSPRARPLRRRRVAPAPAPAAAAAATPPSALSTLPLLPTPLFEDDAVGDSAPPAAPGGVPPPPPLRPYPAWRLPPGALDGCEPFSPSPSPSRPRLRVAVLLSGGVDSCVALHLVRAAGHDADAFYLRIWHHEDFRTTWAACPWDLDLAHCRAACAQAGVRLRVLPLSEAYAATVLAACLADLKTGRTPNPDVLCNGRVKFGAFLSALDAHTAAGGDGPPFDRVATGHYARLVRPPAPAEGDAAAAAVAPLLMRCADNHKDQTYFLAGLSPLQLRRAMFPLQSLTKAEVRAVATEQGLPPAGRPDSQGLCFLGKVPFSEFVTAHLGEMPGGIYEAETGALLGSHSGAFLYTVGQRQGLRLSGGPWYVAARDPVRRAVYATRRYHPDGPPGGGGGGSGGHQPRRDVMRVGAFSWTGAARPAAGPAAAAAGLRVRVRHGAADHGVALFAWESAAEAAAGDARARAALDALARRAGLPDAPPPQQPHPPGPTGPTGPTALVALDGWDHSLAPGQYAVFYDAEGLCLGCGTILAGGGGGGGEGGDDDVRDWWAQPAAAREQQPQQQQGLPPRPPAHQQPPPAAAAAVASGGGLSPA